MYSDYRQRNSNQQQQAEQYHILRKQVESDIHENNAEIKYLDNKIVKDDYDHGRRQKLQIRQQALLSKQRELQEILKNQNYMQQQIHQQKLNDKDFKHSLANEYMQMCEEKKYKNHEERKKIVEDERHMIEKNRRSFEEDEVRRKQQVDEQRRFAQEQLAMREQMRMQEREQREREKEQYNNKVRIRSQVETQKDSVYKQYYNQFMENQDKLHNIYLNKAAISDGQRLTERNQFQSKEIQDYQQRVVREQEKRAIKMKEDKDMLKNFLQNQIEQGNRKKSRQKEEEQEYHHQVARYQLNTMQVEQMQRSRKKEQQRRYDEELKMQTRNRGYSMSAAMDAKQTHNPITNPIDFKIGITNPYLIRQYQQAKERYMGDSNLKLRNLAMVGSQSLAQK